MYAVADVVEDRFFIPRFFYGIHHALDERGHFFRRFPVVRFIADFNGDEAGVVFISHAGIRVDVVHKLEQVVLLGFDGAWIGQAIVFSVFGRKTRRWVIRLRPAVAPKGDGGEYVIDVPLA